MKQLDEAQKCYWISATTAWTIVIAPFVILFGFAFLLWLPQTGNAVNELTYPKHPIEWTMFGVHFLAGMYGLRLAYVARQNHEPAQIYVFYLLFSLALLFIAGEINAWGQKFVEYQTPSWFEQHNAMGIVTLHNLYGFDNNNHRLRLIFALGGFVGIALQRSRKWNRIAAPSILGWWFGLIAVKCLLDIWVKNFPNTSTNQWLLFNWIVYRTSKIAKVMIGICAWLYLWLNKRRLEREWTRGPKVAAELANTR